MRSGRSIGATGLARWACVEAEAGRGAQTGAEWAGLQPDMSDCKSDAVAQLERDVREEAPENAIASTMASLTGGRRALFGGDLETASSVLRTVATRLQYLLQTQSFRHGGKERYVSAVFGDVVRSVSNLLSRRPRVAWNDLHISRQMKVIQIIDTIYMSRINYNSIDIHFFRSPRPFCGLWRRARFSWQTSPETARSILKRRRARSVRRI